MGNKATRGIPEESVTSATNAVTEVVDTFRPLYSQAQGVCALDQLTAAHPTGNPDEPIQSKWSLRRPPHGVEPLAEGWLTKLGAKTKNWKRRYFVATNEADGYAVYYFEKQEHKSIPSKKKGYIAPCGYIVKSLKSEVDIREYGDHVLELRPADERRVWHVRCADEVDRARWKSAFKHAALQAKPPLSTDPVAAAAFRSAYYHTRRKLGMWGWYRIELSEEEQLARLCVQRCEDLVMPAVYESIPVDKDEPRVRATIAKELRKLVESIVQPAWKALQPQCDARRVTVQRPLMSGAVSCDSLQTVHAELRRQLQTRTQQTVRTYLHDMVEPVILPILSVALKPVYQAYKTAIQIFWAKMNEILGRGLRENELRAFFKSCKWDKGALAPAFSKLRALTRAEEGNPDTARVWGKDAGGGGMTPLDLLQLLQGVTLWEVEVEVERSIIKLISWATYSFVFAVEEGRGVAVPAHALHQTMHKLVADAKLRAAKNLCYLFSTVFVPPVHRQLAAAATIQEALQTTRGEISESDRAYLSEEWIFDGIVKETCQDVIVQFVETDVDAMLGRMQKLAGKLGF